MAKKSKFTEETAIPKNQMGNEFYLNEIKLHRYISVSQKDNLLLYLANQLGRCFPENCWSKKKKLQRLYEKGADKIESRLNIVKINQNQTDVKVLLKKFNSMMDPDTIFNIRHSKKNLINLDETSDGEDCEAPEFVKSTANQAFALNKIKVEPFNP